MCRAKTVFSWRLPNQSLVSPHRPTDHNRCCILMAALLSTATARQQVPVYFDSPCTCKNNHMEDRKAAKNDPATLPSQASKFIKVTPSTMYGWPPLPGLNDKSPRKHQERQWCKVTGRVVDVRVQEDGDIHFELQDVTGTKSGHILAEVPLGRNWCDLRKTVLSWTTKGTRFKRFQAAARLQLQKQPVVTVSGKHFFDTHHARKNPLRNISNNNKIGILAAWEIHPVSVRHNGRSICDSP
jgi:hypothetical protein